MSDESNRMLGFRVSDEEYTRFQRVVERLRERETIGKVTSKSAFLRALSLVEKWLDELERKR